MKCAVLVVKTSIIDID